MIEEQERLTIMGYESLQELRSDEVQITGDMCRSAVGFEKVEGWKRVSFKKIRDSVYGGLEEQQVCDGDQ